MIIVSNVIQIGICTPYISTNHNKAHHYVLCIVLTTTTNKTKPTLTLLIIIDVIHSY